jgi:hypothetical protein
MDKSAGKKKTAKAFGGRIGLAITPDDRPCLNARDARRRAAVLVKSIGVCRDTVPPRRT